MEPERKPHESLCFVLCAYFETNTRVCVCVCDRERERDGYWGSVLCTNREEGMEGPERKREREGIMGEEIEATRVGRHL